MKISIETINFNKEILFGEIGAIFGIQIVNYTFNKMNYSVNLLSYMVVIGAIIGASLFWFCMRFYDKTRKKKYPEKDIVEDISYLVPASFILTSILYYPTLFLITKYLIEQNKMIEYVATIPQIIAFCLYLISINIYRYILKKYYHKTL
jgi:hypothetical protein